MPAMAKHRYEFNDGLFKGETLEFDRWGQAKCDTYADFTKAQNRRFVDHCIGRTSKHEYAQRYAQFLKAYEKADDTRVERIRKQGLMALVHPDVKWKSDKYVKDIMIVKATMTGLGIVTAAVATIATGGIIAHYANGLLAVAAGSFG